MQWCQHSTSVGHCVAAGVLDRPEIDLSTGELTLKTEGGLGAIDIGGQKGTGEPWREFRSALCCCPCTNSALLPPSSTGGGDYRVLLLDSEKHTEPHIVQVKA